MPKPQERHASTPHRLRLGISIKKILPETWKLVELLKVYEGEMHLDLPVVRVGSVMYKRDIAITNPPDFILFFYKCYFFILIIWFRSGVCNLWP